MKVEVIPESEAERPLVFSGVAAEVHHALSSIQPGQVLRITLGKCFRADSRRGLADVPA